jgi:hypothetical protein
MTAPAITTRSELEAYRGLDPEMVEKLAERAYEAGKPTGSSLPPWPKVEPTYQAEVRRAVIAVISGGVDAGYLRVRGRG